MFTRRRMLAAATGLLVAAATVIATAPAVASTEAAAAAWQPKAPPLTTPWTDQVSPTNALPEYPRPQLVRSEWQNLNGEWEFTGAPNLNSPPLGQTLPERVLVPYPIESALSGIQRHELRRVLVRHHGRTPRRGERDRGRRLLPHRRQPVPHRQTTA